MEMAYSDKISMIPGMVQGLLTMLNSNGPSAHAGAWALGWLAKTGILVPGKKETEQVITFASNPSADIEAVRFSTWILGKIQEPQAIEFLVSKLEDNRGGIIEGAFNALKEIGDVRAVEPLLKKLDHENNVVVEGVIDVLGQIGDIRAMEPLLAKLDHENSAIVRGAMYALGKIGDSRAVEALLAKLDYENSSVRKAALGALASIDENEQDRKLLSHYLDGGYPFLDPRLPIPAAMVEKAAKELNLSPSTVRRRYERLAAKYGMRLEKIEGEKNEGKKE
jgi:HEAT repeat protein